MITAYRIVLFNLRCTGIQFQATVQFGFQRRGYSTPPVAVFSFKRRIHCALFFLVFCAE